MWPRERYASSRPQTSTCMNTIGLLTTRILLPLPRTAMVMTIGMSLNFTLSQRPQAKRNRFTSLRYRSLCHWSPDGRKIAFVEGLMSDEGSTGGDVFVMSAMGDKPQDVTPNMKASASWLD